MQNTNYPKYLHELVHDLLLDLQIIFSENAEEENDMTNIIFLYQCTQPETTMAHTIEHLLPHKKYIDNEDLSFFSNNDYLFQGLPSDRVSHYKNEILINNRLSQDDMKCLWDYLKVIIAAAECHSNIT